MQEIINSTLYFFLFLSLVSNSFLIWYIGFAVKKAKREAAKEPEKTYDVKALLADLSVGSALIRMDRIDPHDVLLRSPRQNR